MNEQFHFFWDGPFSQWYRSNFKEGINTFCTAEQYMMYRKALLMGDRDAADRIMSTNSPRRQKEIGREIKNFNEKLWNEHKRKIVFEGNVLKFTQNEGLRMTLIGTGTKTLVEASPYDRIWGIGLSEAEARETEPSQWKGENLLGLVLTDVREHIKTREPSPLV